MNARKSVLPFMIACALGLGGVAAPSTCLAVTAAGFSTSGASNASGASSKTGSASNTNVINDKSTQQTTTEPSRRSVRRGQSTEAKHAKNLAGITVTGVLGSLLRETTTKRTNPGIVDSISAEEVGTFPDTTVAAALQRVPGVSVNRNADGEANQISVRGFGPQFVNVLLNGHSMATTSFSRAFNLDVLPVQLLQQAVVYKTFQPNLPVGGIGGTVNIVTWQPLEFNGFHATVRAGLRRSDLPGGTTSKTKPVLSAMIGDTSHDGRFGWLLAYSFAQRDQQFTDMNFDGGWPALNLPLISPTKTFPMPTDNEGTYDFQTRTRRATDLSIEAKPTSRLRVTGNFLMSTYSGHDNRFTNDIFTEVSTINSITTDGNGTPTSYTTNGVPGVQDVFKPQSDPTDSRVTSGSIKLHYRIGDGNTIALEADASHGSSSSIGFNGVSGYFFNTGAPVSFHNPEGLSPAFPYFTGGVGSANVTNLRTHYPEPGGPKSSDWLHTQSLNLKHQFVNGIVQQIEVGVSNNIETQSSEEFQLPDHGNALVPFYDPFNVVVPPAAVDAHIVTFDNFGGKYGAHWPKSFVTYDPQKMLIFMQTPAAYDQLSPAKRQQFLAFLASQGGTIKVVPNPTSSENVREVDRSAYIMVNLASSLGSHDWSAQLGVRYTHTALTSSGLGQKLLALQFDPGDLEFAQPVFSDVEALKERGNYHYFLPSVNIKYHLAANVILRGAYSKTLTRPPLGDLATSRSFGTEARISESSGNPQLKPFLSRNFDLGAAWYFGGPSYVSLDLFEKRVRNFVTTITSTVPVSSVVPSISPQIKGSLINQGLFLTRPVNLNNATVKGFEVTFNYSFAKALPGWLSGFGVATNYSHVNSNAESTAGEVANGSFFALPGMGSSYNASVYYQKYGASMRLAYNVRNGYLVSAAGAGGVPVSAARFGELDFSATYKVTKRLSFFLNADNLNNESVFQYSLYQNRPILGSEFGRRFAVGVSWSL